MTAGLVCWMLMAAGVARAGQDVLRWVPKNALGFVAIHDLAGFDAKWTTVTQTVGATVPGPLAMVKTTLGLAKGLDEKGTVVLIAMPGDEAGDRPRPVLLIPTTDYKAFVGQLQPEKATDAVSKVSVAGTSALVAEKEGYAVMVETDDRELLDAVLAGKVEAMALGEWKTWLDKCDVVAVASQAGLDMVVKGARLPDDDWSAMSPSAAGPLGWIAYSHFVPLMKMGRDEMNAAAVGLVVESDGSLHATLQARCKAGSKLTETLARTEALPKDVLAGLPGDEFLYAAAGRLPQPPRDEVAGLSPDAEEWKPVVERVTAMGEAASCIAAIAGVPKEGRPMDEMASMVVSTTDAGKWVEDYAWVLRESLKMEKSARNAKKDRIKIEDVALDGLKAVKITTDMKAMFAQTFGENSQMDEETRERMEATLGEIIKKLYGPDGKEVVWLVAANPTRVVFSYGDEAKARATVALGKTPEKSLAGNADLAKTAAKLPEGAQGVAYLNPMGMTKMQGAMGPAAAMLGLPGDMPPSPPIGLAVKGVSDTVEVQLDVPAATIKAAGPLFRLFAPAFGGRPPQAMPAEPPAAEMEFMPATE